MKKQILFTTIVISSLGLFSCRKDNAELSETQSRAVEQSNVAVNTAERLPYINPVTYKLEGAFLFNGNLEDSTGKLVDGQMVAPSVTTSYKLYATDRKGNPNSALNLDGNYYVNLSNVPQHVNTSISLWVKRGAYYSAHDIIYPNGNGWILYQGGYAFKAAIKTSAGPVDATSPNYVDNAWHHIVETYDGDYLKIYVDGTLAAQKYFPGFISTQLVWAYGLGFGTSGNYWKGAIDEVRFYSRTLTASDVQTLYHL